MMVSYRGGKVPAASFLTELNPPELDSFGFGALVKQG